MKFAIPGDIIARKYDSYLDNKLIPGDYCHAGIVIDDETVIHAISEGVCKIDVIDMVKDCDNFILLRPRNVNKDILVLEASKKLGFPYDFAFNGISADRFFCFELVMYCLRKASGNSIPAYGRLVYYKDIAKLCEEIYKC